MSTTTYAVYAYSPVTNQKVRQFDLANINTPQLDAHKAQQAADIFAHIQNQNHYLNTQDWRGVIELEQHGIDTLDNFLYVK
jgi:hypothetical protein